MISVTSAQFTITLQGGHHRKPKGEETKVVVKLPFSTLAHCSRHYPPLRAPYLSLKFMDNSTFDLYF